MIEGALEPAADYDLVLPAVAVLREHPLDRVVTPSIAAQRLERRRYVLDQIVDSRCRASNSPRSVLKPDESCSGSSKPNTFSGPSAFTASAAHTELSMPPDIAMTNPCRERSFRRISLIRAHMCSTVFSQSMPSTVESMTVSLAAMGQTLTYKLEALHLTRRGTRKRGGYLYEFRNLVAREVPSAVFLDRHHVESAAVFRHDYGL